MSRLLRLVLYLEDASMKNFVVLAPSVVRLVRGHT